MSTTHDPVMPCDCAFHRGRTDYDPATDRAIDAVTAAIDIEDAAAVERLIDALRDQSGTSPPTTLDVLREAWNRVHWALGTLRASPDPTTDEKQSPEDALADALVAIGEAIARIGGAP